MTGCDQAQFLSRLANQIRHKTSVKLELIAGYIPDQKAFLNAK